MDTWPPRLPSGKLARFTGIALLFLGFVWIAWDLSTHYPPHRRLEVLTSVVGFEGSPQLPPQDIEAALEGAKQHVDSRVACSDWYATAARACDWTAFVLTAVITLIGGFLGLAPDSAGTAPSIAAIQSRSSRLGRIVALLAAVGAIVTAAGAKAQTTSDTLFRLADEMRKTTTMVRKDVSDATTPSAARLALSQLEALRSGCQTR